MPPPTPPSPQDLLRVRGAREHNLQGIDLDLPRGRLIVCAGVSGSGKTSFAFDTVYAEAQRRFVEALAPGLRNRFGAMRRPDVEQITGLTPAIGVSQHHGSPSPRATVGTLTEVHDLLRVLWARLGQQHCPRCDRPIHTDTVDGIVRALLQLPDGARLTLCAPVLRGRTGSVAAVIEEVRRQGFSRVRLDTVILGVEEVPAVDARVAHDLDIVIDRVRLAADRKARLQDSVATAVRAGRGAVVGVTDDGERSWGTRPRCVACDLDLPTVAPRLFSFNTPAGACAACEGLGVSRSVDPERLVDPARTLDEGAVEGGERVLAAARARDIPTQRRWSELTWEQRHFLLHGGEPDTPWEGAVRLATRRATRADAPERLRRLLREETCPACQGARLDAAGRAVRVGELNLPTLAALPLPEARAWLSTLPRDAVTTPLLDELDRRLGFLIRAGLGHLTLDRSAPSLSAGELQRVRLGATAGNQLSGVLYVLDEPTAGLHPRDTAALLTLLLELRDAGNTVLVVEHDPAVLLAADLVVDFGPGAGREGGRIVYAGPPAGLLEADTPTGRWLSSREHIPPADPTAAKSPGALVLTGARGHNLRAVDLRVPLRSLTAVTGVSGAGKSSLVEDTLGRALSTRLGLAGPAPLPYDTLQGAEAIQRLVTASSVGRSSRSMPVTLVLIWDALRALYARTPEARLRGWGADRFSLASAGGRCEACQGMGLQRVDLHYLPELTVTCEVCEGRRYEESTLAVTFRGVDLATLLAMPVREARRIFEHIPAVARPLGLLDELGLGYLPLGQPGDTLSGGEAQRLGLARELARPGECAGTLYLLDEPSVGLHPADIATLVIALRRIVAAGGTVLLIEHDPLLVGACDTVVELGPGAGAEGGRIVG